MYMAKNMLFKDEAAKMFWEYNLSLNPKNSCGRMQIEFASCWAKRMQVLMSEGRKLEDIAECTARECNNNNISKFGFGNAIWLLSNTWKFGEELRQWNNKKRFGYSGDGVVNPVVLVTKAS